MGFCVPFLCWAHNNVGEEMYKLTEYYDENGVETYCNLAEKKGYKIVSMCAVCNPEALLGNSVDMIIYYVLVSIPDVAAKTQEVLVSVAGSMIKRNYEEE
jgi:hypothetical protein